MEMHTRDANDCIDIEINDVIEKYSSMVYRIAFSKTNSKNDADDIFQEVFLRYIKNKKPFKDEEHRKAWLIRVTVNCCNKLFSSSWFKKTEPLSEISDNATVTVSMDSDEKELYEAVMELPDNYRIVIYLFYYEEMSIDEISKALKISKSNVKVRLTRARNSLKKFLEGGALDE